MSDAMDFRACVEAIEAGYEFMLAYAAQGREKEAGSAPVRAYLEPMSVALGSIGAAVDQEIKAVSGSNAEQLSSFASELAEDARRAKAAVDVVLSVPTIGSQIVDNLNASIHLRSLLTSVFLIDEALRVS